MKAFDLHCHPTLKPLLTLKENRNSPWYNIQIKLDNIADNIYDSQSNPDQLLIGNCNIACVGLMAIERAFADQVLAQIAAGWADNIDKRQLWKIRDMEVGCTYSELLDQEIASVINNAQSDDGNKMRFIKSFGEYNKNDNKTLHLIGSLEGGHTLYYGKNEYSDHEKVVAKVKKFRQGDPIRLLYITLSHLSQNAMANHAYGMKIFSKNDFAPSGNGITELGHKVIKACLEDNASTKPIFIDIKHLSLKSRIEFYNTYGTDHPIIASHVAVTGCSYEAMPISKVKRRKRKGWLKVVYDKQKGYLPGTYFNPNSINLYDEDIENILKSGGLIGLILDERVLGYSNKKLVPDWIEKERSKEFVSMDEEDVFLNPGDYVVQDESVDFDNEDELDENIEREFLKLGGHSRDISKAHLHLRYLVNNIVHIVRVGKSVGIDARKHIVIGSDLDGLVNTIDSCTTAAQYGNLYDQLKENINRFAFTDIPNVDQFVDDMFYNNGYEFLKKNFQ